MTSACPELENLRALLEESGACGDPAELVQHLETCAGCQRTLADLAAEEALWEDAAHGLVDPTRDEPTLRNIVEQLKTEAPPSPEDEDLAFLRPADKPGLLGTLGPYEMTEVSGRGGMGVVLKAWDPGLDRVVAIKVLSPALAASATARRRFVREGRAAAAVCHDHIVAVHGVHEANGLPYLVMQHVAGESLQARLDRSGPLEIKEAVRIARQVALALAAAHGYGLIHRDVKPANILLEEGSGRAKLTDFGLARLADDIGLTQNGVVAGTPEYMAPEQARGEPVDQRADLFSLGSVLYAMTTGRPPFGGSTTLGVLRQVSDQAPTPIGTLNSSIPAWLEAVVGRLLAKNSADRFQRAEEVAALLDSYLKHLDQPDSVPAPELPPALIAVLEQEGWPVMTKQRSAFGNKFWFTALWAAGGAAILLIVFWLAGRTRDRFYHDFRGRRLPGAVRPFGPQAGRFVQPEAEGLRISLPEDRAERQPVGVSLALPVSGDFEVTATVEIVKADEPPPSTFGIGILMRADETARMSRLVRANGEQVIVWDQWIFEDPQPRLIGDVATCPANVLRLRMKRTGNTLAYLWAPETKGDDFQLLHQGEFRTDDVKIIELIAETGTQPCALDVRFLDLRVSVVPGTAQRMWWIAGAGVVVLVGGLVGWRFVPSPAPVMETTSTVETAPADSAPAAVVQCPKCQRRLRVSAKAAGKKVTCPGCDAAFVA